MRSSNLHPRAVQYAYIEAVLATSGFIQSRDVQETFGLSRNAASEAVNNYMSEHPTQAVRDRQGFAATPHFALTVLRGLDPKTYLKTVEQLLKTSEKLVKVA